MAPEKKVNPQFLMSALQHETFVSKVQKQGTDLYPWEKKWHACSILARMWDELLRCN